MLKQEYTHLSIFEGLHQGEITLIDPLLEECILHQGETIFEQGQYAIYLYILLKGEVQVSFKPYDGPDLVVARIPPGGVFGWSAVLGRSIYTSQAVALFESIAVRIRGDQLHQFCENNPKIGEVVLERLASVIAERLRSTHTQILSILTEGLELTEESRRRLQQYDGK